MKLKQINIVHFGQFSNQTFVLPSSQLDVFFGANEAGKSTVVAFIKQIMFGFHLRRSAAPFFEDYQPLAHVSPMGGSLLFQAKDGEYELERLYAKGDQTKRGILTVKKDGQVVPPNLFFDQIQKIDGDFYADSFIFNQEMLARVTGLSQKDLLERIYYLGAADSSKLLQMRDAFAKEAGKLFKKTGRKPEVNQLLKEIETDRKQLADRQNEFKAYQVLQQALTAKKQTLAAKQALLNKLQAQKQTLTALQKELGNYQKLLNLKKQVKKVTFDGVNYQKTQNLQAQGHNLQQRIDRLEKQLQQQPANEIDLSGDQKIIQKRPELLEWQAEYHDCQQKAQQLQQAQTQLLTLTPNLKAVLEFSPQQMTALKTAYAALPPQMTVSKNKAKPKSNAKTWYLLGGLLSAAGVVLLGMLGPASLVILLVGIGLIVNGYLKQKQAQKQAIAILAKQQTAQAQRTAFQQKYGLDPDQLDLNNLQSNLNQYRFQENTAQANQQHLQTINRQVAALAKTVQTALKRPVATDFEPILNALNELEAKIQQQQQLNKHRLNLIATLKEDQQDFKDLTLKLQALLAKAGVKDLSAYEKLYQESLAQAKLQAQIEALESSLKADLPQLKQAAATPQALPAKLADLETHLQQSAKEVHQLQGQAAEVQVKLNNLADSTAVFKAKQDLANTETRFKTASQEYLASLFASQWIARALDLASNERFPKMLKAAKEYLQLLTGGRYTEINLAKKLTVVRADGKKREVKYLSRGTAEQLYFALKLAFIEQIKDKINLPILIDDSFVNFDDQRIIYIKKLLAKISLHNQVLIFTAQKNLVDRLQVKPLTFTKGTQNA